MEELLLPAAALPMSRRGGDLAHAAAAARLLGRESKDGAPCRPAAPAAAVVVAAAAVILGEVAAPVGQGVLLVAQVAEGFVHLGQLLLEHRPMQGLLRLAPQGPFNGQVPLRASNLKTTQTKHT